MSWSRASAIVTVSRSWPMLTIVGPKSGSTSYRCDCEPYLAAVRANWRILIAARTWRARSRLDAGWTAQRWLRPARAPNRLFCAAFSPGDRRDVRHGHCRLVAVPAGQCGRAGWAWRGSSGMARQLSTPMAMTVAQAEGHGVRGGAGERAEGDGGGAAPADRVGCLLDRAEGAAGAAGLGRVDVADGSVVDGGERGRSEERRVGKECR